MTELKQASELSIQQYVASIGLNPQHVYYNRTTTNNKSTANLQWTLIAPAQRLLMLDIGEIDLTFPILKQRSLANGGGAANEQWRAEDYVSLKEAFPLTNSMTSITTIINGATQTMNQPRYWFHQLAMMYGGRKGMEICNSHGGKFWDLQGEYSPHAPNAAISNYNHSLNHIYDYYLQKNEQNFKSGLIKSNNNAIPANQVANYVLREKIVSPPFNPFSKVKKDLPDYCWFKHMSPVIGNVSRLEIDIQMTNFAPSLLFYRVAQNNNNTANQVATLTISSIAEAGLTLYWYKLPDKMEIPRSLVYQTWSVRQFVKSLSVPLINDNAALVSQVSDLIQLHSIPTLILIAVQRDRDFAAANENYVVRALEARDSATPENRNIANYGNNSMDDYAEIESLQVEFGDKTGIITTARKQEELYYITTKNSITKDFPYDYFSWKGKRTATKTARSVAAAAILFNYPSKCFMAFRPKDLGIGMSDGVQHNITFKITEMNIRARSALPSLGVWNHSYRMYVHVFYGKHTLELTPESGKFSEQRFTLDSTRAVGGSLKMVSDDSRYVSRMPKF